MKRHFLAATAAFALLAPAAVAQTSSDTSSGAATMDMTNLTAEQFVTMAASSNMFEIESSEAALEKAGDDLDDDVEEFAQEMVTDHTAAGEKMMEVAQAAGVTPPTAMTEKHEQMFQELSAVSDNDAFEAAYVDAQVMAHEEAVALFSAYAENDDNAELKAFAAETLPTLQEHLEEVQDLDEDS